jgi:hypothetical protein
MIEFYGRPVDGPERPKLSGILEIEGFLLAGRGLSYTTFY